MLFVRLSPSNPFQAAALFSEQLTWEQLTGLST